MKDSLKLMMGLTLILLFVMPICLKAQDFYTDGQINTIQIYFPQSNWDQLLDNLVAAGQEERLIGTAIINGVTYDSVGVRYKGNSSYSASRNKNPLNIKLDYIHDEQLMDGVYGTIKLSNGFNDPSFIRETLSYEIARKYMPASKANYANVYINDALIGFYTSVQDVDSYFMRTHLYSSGKPRFKSETNPTGNPVIWGYLGTDSTAYMSKYEIESDSGWDELINFTNVLNNDQNNVATVLNIDRHLWFLAFENLFDNFDSPINIFHNFYLFQDENNRFNPIIWDLNESFGVFNHIGASNLTLTQLQNYDPLANLTSTTHTLISKILSNLRYKKMYIAHMRTMINENFSNGWYATRGAELQSLISSSVQADNNKFFTYANFQSNLNTTITGGRTIPGITALMNTRSTFLLNHTAFQGALPVINTITHSPEAVSPNTNVVFTLTATDANYAQLGIRQDVAHKFDYYQMYDDGLHSDGLANDGVFGVEVMVGYGNIEYYGWAENSAQGVFYPARAEQEFLSIVVAAPIGDIVINEINYNSSEDFDPGDWVELYNPGLQTVDVSGWIFKDSSDEHIFTIPNNTLINADGYLVLCESLSDFAACFPDVNQVLGDFDFGLSSSGEAVRLYTNTGVTIDSVYYGVTAPWATAPNGTGATLQLISPLLDNTLAGSWQASSGNGSPGVINSFSANEDEVHVLSKDMMSVYPNPFNLRTTVEYALTGKRQNSIIIYDIKGRKIKNLFNAEQSKGSYKIVWNGMDEHQTRVGSGIYFVVMKNGDKVIQTRKIVILK